MFDLALDNQNDIGVENSDLKQIAGVDVVKQRLLIRLRLFYGEWLYDEDAGIPYWRDVLTSAPKSRMVEAVFRREILAAPEIERLLEFSIELNRSTRTLTVTFTAVSSEGEVTISEVFP